MSNLLVFLLATLSSSECLERAEVFSQLITTEKTSEAEQTCTMADLAEECGEFQADCLRRLRDYYSKKQDDEAAFRMATRLKKAGRAGPQDLIELGRAAAGLGQWNAALESFEAAEKSPEIWKEARYNRLLLLEARGLEASEMRFSLWKELIARAPKDPDFRLGFALHLAKEKKFKPAYFELKKLNPAQAKAILSKLDEEFLDSMFADLFPKIQSGRQKAFITLWSRWVPESATLSLSKARILAQERKFSDALQSMERATLLAKKPLPGADFLSGVIHSYLNHHEKAAAHFDACAVRGDDDCVSWLAKELAYLGRWDLAAIQWKKTLGGRKLKPSQEKVLRRMLNQANHYRAEELAEKGWGFPRWMEYRFP